MSNKITNRDLKEFGSKNIEIQKPININNQIKEREMKMFSNWKTTTVAIVTGLSNVLHLFGISIPTNEINIVALFLIGIFAKDGTNQN